jgi:uroporphyrinogen decarboxylase
LTPRERFLATVRFQSADRLPLWEYGAWPQTVQRWRKEGLPADKGWPSGHPGAQQDAREGAGPSIASLPPFKEETLAEDDRTVTIRRSDGRVTRALKEGTLNGVRTCMDQYLDAPVHNRADFDALRFRYCADTPERYPADWAQRAERWKTREHPLNLCGTGAHLGLYMQLRSWMGTEQLCFALYDQPSLVHEMLEFFTDFLLSLLERALQTVQFDFFYFAEDFAYKNGPLVSPAHFREFFVPRYRRIVDRLHRAGTDTILLDSDGNCELLIPQLLEVGINAIEPLEAAAGMDPLRLRKEYPKDLILMGGLDKRAVAAGPAAMERELRSKILPLRDRGCYIPHLDHLFTHDISYPNLLHYLELKAKLCGA